MNRASWIILTLGLIGVTTVILIMRKKCSCKANSNPLADPNLTVLDLGDGTETLVDSDNNIVATKGYAQEGYTYTAKSSGDLTAIGDGTKLGGFTCTHPYPYKCDNGWCVKDKDACDNW